MITNIELDAFKQLVTNVRNVSNEMIEFQNHSARQLSANQRKQLIKYMKSLNEISMELISIQWSMEEELMNHQTKFSSQSINPTSGTTKTTAKKKNLRNIDSFKDKFPDLEKE